LTLHRLTRRTCGTRSTGRTLRAGLRLHPRDRALTGTTLGTGLTAQRLTCQRRGLRAAWGVGRRAHRGRHGADSRARRTRSASGTRSARCAWLLPRLLRLILLHPRLRRRGRGLIACGRLIAAHHRHRALRHRRRSWRGGCAACANRCRDGLRGLARRSERGGLYTRAALSARCGSSTLLRGGRGGNGGGRRDFIADLSARLLLRLGVVLAHDRGEIEIFNLRRLIPGVAAACAFQSAALLSQQLCWDFKMRRTARAGYAHSTTHVAPAPLSHFCRRSLPETRAWIACYTLARFSVYIGPC
jgi:hypothetical protein